MNFVRLEREEKFFNILAYAFITLLMLLCLLPFLMIVSGSFSSEDAILKDGYSILPRDFSLSAYAMVFANFRQVLQSYWITIQITVLGTAASLLFSSMAAFALFRPDFRARNHFAFFFYFTTIFTGGLVPQYIWMVQYLHLKNTLLALILPAMIVPFSIFLLRNFMKSVPPSVMESAIIDGANDFLIYLKIYIPLTVPGLVTVGLFRSLFYWNNWMLARLYITKTHLYPIQFYLYNVLSAAENYESIAAEAGISVADMPTETMKLALSVIATGPIVLLYPFAQRYFVKGITLGSVKG